MAGSQPGSAPEAVHLQTAEPEGAQEERVVPLCPDQADWLAGLADRYGMTGTSQWLALELLVKLANREPPQTKKMIFLVVRCHRCLQHTRGGEKRDCPVALPVQQWQWLEGVRERCKHPTVGKTLRIIVDFYRPILDKDPEFERRVLAAAVPTPARAEAPGSPRTPAVVPAAKTRSDSAFQPEGAVMGG
mmetsp:Transcript_48359/g.109601  ORF Transcript_48359/g.109601 Transcript_48359/m.109601 type:complete len:189 (-) Transcript_48359:29-595(-)